MPTKKTHTASAETKPIRAMLDVMGGDRDDAHALVDAIPNERFGTGRKRFTRKLVLLAIAKNAKPDGTGAYPSLEVIAHRCLMTVQGVLRVIKELITLQLLRKEIRGHKSSKRGRTNVYTILFEAPEPAVSGVESKTPEPKGAGVKKEHMNPQNGTPETTVLESPEHLNPQGPTPEPSGSTNVLIECPYNPNAQQSKRGNPAPESPQTGTISGLVEPEVLPPVAGGSDAPPSEANVVAPEFPTALVPAGGCLIPGEHHRAVMLQLEKHVHTPGGTIWNFRPKGDLAVHSQQIDEFRMECHLFGMRFLLELHKMRPDLEFANQWGPDDLDTVLFQIASSLAPEDRAQLDPWNRKSWLMQAAHRILRDSDNGAKTLTTNLRIEFQLVREESQRGEPDYVELARLLAGDLLAVSGTAFGKHEVGLEKLVRIYPRDRIVDAFRAFWENLETPYDKSRAAERFVNGGCEQVFALWAQREEEQRQRDERKKKAEKEVEPSVPKIVRSALRDIQERRKIWDLVKPIEPLQVWCEFATCRFGAVLASLPQSPPEPNMFGELEPVPAHLDLDSPEGQALIAELADEFIRRNLEITQLQDHLHLVFTAEKKIKAENSKPCASAAAD